MVYPGLRVLNVISILNGKIIGKLQAVKFGFHKQILGALKYGHVGL